MTPPPPDAARFVRDRHAVLLREDGFDVVHRGRHWGPFSRQWATDLRGLELWYGTRKCAEVCGEEELYADLSEFGLPRRVREVACLVFGVLAWSIRDGRPAGRRAADIAAELAARGLERFVVHAADARSAV